MRQPAHRIVWAFALGYFAFYAPYAALTKAATSGLLDGTRGLSPLALLPLVLLGTLVAAAVMLTLLGWWQYARPFAGAAVVLSGTGTATIIATTTLAYSFDGISIILALLLMRAGVLVLAPLIDSACGRSVRWFSWVALALSLGAAAVALAAVHEYELSLAAALNLAAYLSGYCLRLPAMTAHAKVNDPAVTRRWFVQELLVAMLLLAAFAAVVAPWHGGAVTAAAVAPALTIGALYTLLYLFGTLVYLDRRENTFCVPLNRGASLLAGIAAMAVLSAVYGTAPPPASQLAAATLILFALLLLSPVHHLFERAGALRGATMPGPVRVLFVCSGGTCRSPMAAAIANAELALRTGLPLDDVLRSQRRAASAGLTATEGAAMTAASHAALETMAVTHAAHAARALTRDAVEAADVIYCMTRAQHDAVARAWPEARLKTRCLDPRDDIADPAGEPAEVHVEVARRLQRLIRTRFDELGVVARA